jgi:hypothetical protein
VFMSTLWSFRAQKIINLKCEWCILFFFQFVVLQRNTQLFGSNIDKSNVEVRVGVKHFLVHAFEFS